MKRARFSIHGVGVEITAEGSRGVETLTELTEDFRDLAPHGAGKSSIQMHLVDATPWQSSGRRLPLRVWRAKHCIVHGWGRARICSYPGAGLIESRMSEGVRTFWVAESAPASLREAAYKALLSAIGEELDRRGFHRVHALGWEKNERRHLLIAPSGGGKSALATLLTRNSDPVRVFSDENPLLRGGSISAFPLRLALAPQVAEALAAGAGRSYIRPWLGEKKLFPFPASLIANKGPVNVLFLGRVGSAGPRFQKLSRTSAAGELFFALVVGVGLAQMAEWMLRPLAVPSLVGISLRRVRTMFKLLFSVEAVYRFELSTDALANAALVREWSAK